MEVQKFWTKTKIILLIVLLVIIGIIIGSILIHRSNLKKEYIKLEKQFNNAAPNYLLLEQIELDEDEYRKINIKSILKDKLVINKRADDCSGYVIAENSNEVIKYNTYLKCKKIYQTTGYGKVASTKKENKTTTQSEKDTTKPVITLLGSKTETISVGDKYKDAGATATDNIDGDLTDKIKVTGEVDITKAGTYTLKYSVTDKAGNKSSKTRKVVVKEEKVKEEKEEKDTIVPVITFKIPSAYQRICIGDKVDISSDGVYGYSAYDDVDKDITSKVKVTGETGNVSTVGEYTLTYSVIDKAGNETKSTRKYSVVNCNNQTTTPSTPANTNTNSSSNYNPTPSTPPETSTSSSSSSSSQTPNVNTNVQTNPTGISAPDSITIKVGETSSLNASVLPSNATSKTLTYRSLNQGIVKVDSNGIVTGVAPGQSRIIITTSNNKSKGVFVTVE